MKIEIKGRVDEIKDEETRGTFNKREIWLTIDAGDKYPQQVAVEFHKANTTKLDNVRQGDDVTIAADLRGREYNGRRYNSLVGWKIEITAEHGARPQTPTDEGAKTAKEPEIPFGESVDLPF